MDQLLSGEKGRKERGNFSIRAYIGVNGSGKTLCMVHDALQTMALGRPVLSTVKIIDAVTGLDHPLYVPLVDFRQLLEWTYGEILMDEITGIASSSVSAGLPLQVENFIPQLRRRDVTMSWTAISWKRANIKIREVSQSLTLCRGLLPKKSEDTRRIWRDNRLFKFASYDAQEFEEWTIGKKEKIKPYQKGFYWREGNPAMLAYRTLETVSSLGAAAESGLCMVCGGKRSMPKCACVLTPRPLKPLTLETAFEPRGEASLPSGSALSLVGL